MTEMDLFVHASRQMSRLVAEIQQGDWGRPVPSMPGCSVRDLVGYVAYENMVVPTVLANRTRPEKPHRPGETLADEPQVVWTVTAAAAEAAVKNFNDLERAVTAEHGQLSARSYLREAFVGRVIYWWDLARALHVDDTIETGLVQAAWEFADSIAEAWRHKGTISEEVAAPPDASIQTKLLALMGRRA